tara:strand:- start:400 stop:906 length:507 start_codon:yes stop_codon:yes gene_type:complete
MEVLMSNYTIDNIRTNKEVDVTKTNLWVWHANKIPPHIGISVGNRYFSLKANGKDENVDLDSIKSILDRKSIATLSFELDKDILPERLNHVFNSYSTTIPGVITCLNPIKILVDCQDSNKLVELLKELYIRDSILRVIGYNIPENFKGIRDYSIDDIHNRLTKLSNGE